MYELSNRRFSNFLGGSKGARECAPLKSLRKAESSFRSALVNGKESNILRSMQADVLVNIELAGHDMDLEFEDREFRRKYPNRVRDEFRSNNYPEPILHAAELILDNRVVSNIPSQIDSTLSLKVVAGRLVDAFDELLDVAKVQAKRDSRKYPMKVVDAFKQFDSRWCSFEAMYIASLFHCKSDIDLELSETFTTIFINTITRTLEEKMVNQSLYDDLDASVMLLVPRLSVLWLAEELASSSKPIAGVSPLLDSMDGIVKGLKELSYEEKRELALSLYNSVFETAPETLNNHSLFLQVCCVSDCLFTGDFGSSLKEALSDAFVEYENAKDDAGLYSKAEEKKPAQKKSCAKVKVGEAFCKGPKNECTYCGIKGSFFRKLRKCEGSSHQFCKSCVEKNPKCC
eukprot:Nk52_evm1s1444 gene=Nk52_evmTU1s1444